MEPNERIREALAKKAEAMGIEEAKLRGFRGPKMEREYVELFADDVVAVANLVVKPDKTVQELRAGSKPHVGREEPTVVTIYADHAYHLLDALKGG